MSNFSQEAAHIVLAFWGEDEDFLIEEVASSLAIGRDYARELVRGAIVEELELDESFEEELEFDEVYE